VDNYLQEPKKPWARILRQAGIENMRLHDLRRSLGAWMAISGASLLIISQCLGHKVASSSVTGIYARLSLEPVRQAMETAVRAMLRKGGVIPEEDTVIQFKVSV
jgi:integrase